MHTGTLIQDLLGAVERAEKSARISQVSEEPCHLDAVLPIDGGLPGQSGSQPE